MEKTNGFHHTNGNGQMIADMIGDDHAFTNVKTPLRYDAFLSSDKEKTVKIEHHFRKIMETLGLDLEDESLNGTPYRVAKMFVNEIFTGLKPDQKPRMMVFDNTFKYGQMLVEKNISVNSTCEHHFLPIYGKAHVAYISSGKVIGLSKLNRIVEYYSRRPQVQERLTRQIAEELKSVLKTEDVAVVIEAKHMCVMHRGIKDQESSTITAEYCGSFKNANTRHEFIQFTGMNLNRNV